jgi:hypothetical protein
MMPLVRLVAATSLGAMLAVVTTGLAAGGLASQGSVMLDLLWGRITLVDIYLAFLFGWVWIAWRERSALRAAAWLLATVVLGSLALWAYVLGAAVRAESAGALVLGPHRVRPSSDTRAG